MELRKAVKTEILPTVFNPDSTTNQTLKCSTSLFPRVKLLPTFFHFVIKRRKQYYTFLIMIILTYALYSLPLPSTHTITAQRLHFTLALAHASSLTAVQFAEFVQLRFISAIIVMPDPIRNTSVI
jgi:hypothetical protein